MTTATAPQTQARTTTWAIDPAHTLVELAARHMMFTTVKGRFTGVSGTIVQDAADPTRSTVEVEIDAASITTGEAQRDAHLRSADFLDVENYPKITFRGTGVEGSSERFRVSGELAIRGTSRQVVLDAEFNGRGVNPYGKQVAGFTATTEINRKDFGLTWNVGLEAGGVLVGDTVKIAIDVQAVLQED